MVTLQVLTEDEHDRLVDFLSGDEWPFHGNSRPDAETARRWVVEERRFDGPTARSWWVLADGERAGLVALQELEDPTPVFDLRLAGAFRGRGHGRRVLRLLAEQLFTTTDKSRVEAHVRADNEAMRACLRAAGPWVQEAHHRQAWPDSEGRLHDCVTYTLLRADWESGGRTPVPPLERS